MIEDRKIYYPFFSILPYSHNVVIDCAFLAHGNKNDKYRNRNTENGINFNDNNLCL